MDIKGIFRYFTKPTITEQNSQSANSTSYQIPLTANCVNIYIKLRKFLENFERNFQKSKQLFKIFEKILLISNVLRKCNFENKLSNVTVF